MNIQYITPKKKKKHRTNKQTNKTPGQLSLPVLITPLGWTPRHEHGEGTGGGRGRGWGRVGAGWVVDRGKGG